MIAINELNIMIIEDDPVIADILERYFQNIGVKRVSVLQNAKQALSLSQYLGEYHLLLFDWNAVDDCHEQLFDFLLSIETRPFVVLCIDGNASHSFNIRCPVGTFLFKPFSTEELDNILSRITTC